VTSGATVLSHQPAAPPFRAPLALLAAAFLFNLGQGGLRPSLPLYLQQFFAANYRMVTLIPVVFGGGKWVASLPTGYMLNRLGRRRLMVTGLLVIASSDIASAMTRAFGGFLGLRALAGMGWAMFGTVATTAMVEQPGARRRGRAISLLLMTETLGLLLGSAAGGSLYQRAGPASPFFFEAVCMLVAALAVGLPRAAALEARQAPPLVAFDRRLLSSVLRVPGVPLMSLTSAALMAIQAGVIVFLYPLYLAEHGHLRPETVGYLVSLGVLGRLGGLWLGGSASDWWGRLPVLIPGLFGYGVLLASLTLVTDPILLGLWSVLIGAGGGVVAGLPTVIVGDRVAPAQQGIAIGWLRTATDGGMLLGPLVMGALADTMDLPAVFLCAGALLGALGWGCRRHSTRTRS
jgi:MFS family permease